MTKDFRPWEAKWTTVKELGRGGQGTTFLVTSNDAARRQGVLKTLNRGRSVQARGRMRREVVNLDTLAQARVKVPQVLDGNTEQFTDAGTALYFVMEYIPGKTLKAEIGDRGRLPLEQAAAVALDLCRTVAEAHKNDVLHRDLKPDNIVVRNLDPADLVVVDYGLSYLEEGGPNDLTHSDEQLRNRFLALPEMNTPGGDRRDKRSDVTAVCAVFYYCVTGFEPGHLRGGDGRPPHRRVGFSLRQALPSDGRCEQLEALLDRAFALEVENRFQSCDELAQRLQVALRPAPPDEDPAAVSAELAKILRQQDRKTLLAEYAQLAQQLFQKMMQHVSGLAGRIQLPFTLSVAAFPSPADDTFPQGMDRVADSGYSLNVAAKPHGRARAIVFSVGVQGNQCVLLRAIAGIVPSAGDQPGMLRPATQAVPPQWEELLCFVPDHQPGDERLHLIVNQSVNKALRELKDEILPG